MNATLTINIRVVGRSATAQLQALQKQLAGLQAQQAGAAASGKNFTNVLNAISSNKILGVGRAFSQLGRQLTYSFTLPMVAAATALTKANLNIGRSMTQVRKVYGDLTYSQERVKQETDALAKSFELLSTRFGVHQEEVIDIAAAWASAGSAGSGLAENTKSTLEAMILGDMEASKATQSLIAIQAQWGLSTKKSEGQVSELTYALGVLNIVENQTGITFAGLTDVLERSSGTWRTAGGTLEELAAVAAAMVPAAGSASQAGNAIKTMTTRLIKPTRQAAEALKAMGINVASKEWMGATVTEKLFQMANAFDGLTSAQKQLITATAMGAWQVNRFDILMQDLLKTDGMFARAMDATQAIDEFGNSVDALSEKSRVNKKYQQELLTVLDSSPKKWDIMTNAIRNNLVTAFLPLIPTIMSLLDLFRRLSEWFANLDPNTQQWILIAGLILALIGPLAQLIGAFVSFGGIFYGIAKAIVLTFTTILLPIVEMVVMAIIQLLWLLLDVVYTVMFEMAVAIAGVLGVPLWAVVATVAAVVAAVILVLKTDLEDKLWEILVSIARGIMQLPEVFATAFNAVIKVLGRAVEVIVEGLSYLNPFARHSPSLVDNVRAGVAVILSEYKRLEAIPGLIRNATQALDAFGVASAPGRKSFRHAQLGKLQDEVRKADPVAGAATGPLVDSIMALEAVLPRLAQEISHQELVVARWEAKLEEANRTLDAAEKKLATSEKAFDALGKAISDAESKITDLAGTPIKGMKALEDQIFANEMAQAGLNMQLLEFEKQGLTVDKIKDKMAALNGEIELLGGERNNLRMAGAGSDILKTYDDQIEAIEAQKHGLGETADQILDIEKQLDALDLEHRFLELTKTLNFDPLVRQINELANGVQEMTFDEIVAGIKAQQELIAQLQPQYDLMKAAVEAETAAVEAAKTARDGIADQLDIEQTKLDKLVAAYSDIEALIQDMESAMKDFVSLVESVLGKTEDNTFFEDLLAAAALGDFEVAGGEYTLAPEGDIFDIEKFNEDLQKVIEDMWNFDIWESIKEKWDEVWTKMKAGFTIVSDWVRDHWGPLLGAGIGALAGFLIAGPLGAILGAVLGWFAVEFAPKVWEFLKGHVAETIGAGVGAAIGFALFGPLGALIGAVVGWFAVEFGPKIGGWINNYVIQPIWQALQKAWNSVYGWVRDYIVNPVRTAISTLMQVPTWIYQNVILPIGRTLQGAWNTVWGFVTDFLVHPIQTAFSTVADALLMVWNNVIMPVINFIMQYIVGPLVTAFMALATAISWVWSTIIGPIISFVWENIIKPVFDAIFWFVDNILRPIFWVLAAIVEIVFVSIARIIEWAWEHVISPVFDFIVDHILVFLMPMFMALWAVIQFVWEHIGDIISFAWNWVIKPIFDALSWVVTEVLMPAFQDLWDFLVDVWEGVQTAISYAWNYVIHPIFTAFDWVIRNIVGPVFSWLLDEVITPVWNAIGTAIGWAWDNVISPIFDTIVWVVQNVLAPVWDWIYGIIVDVWNGILYAIGWVWDQIATILEGGVNLFIHAFNAIARTINWIADFLSIDVNIDTMETISVARIPYDEGVSGDLNHAAFTPPKMPNFGPASPANAFAKGGILPIDGTLDGSGSIVRGARAIVGEGSKLWPEFVVPTDPKYRGRAQGLWAQVGEQIGMFADGGPTQPVGDDEYKNVYMGPGMEASVGGNIFTDAAGAVVGAASGMADWAITEAIQAAWALGEPVARGAIDLIPLPFLKEWSTAMIDKLDKWVGDRGEVVGEMRKYEQKPDEAAGSWKPILRYLEANKIPYRAGSTYRPGAVTRVTGNPSWHGLDRAVDIVDPFSASPLSRWNPATLEKIAMAINLGFKPHLKELIYGGTQQWNVLRGSSHNFSGPLMAEHMNHVHAAMAAGGSFGIKARPGGQMVSLLLGEGGEDEKIKVTPLGSDEGGRTINIYGDLSFPNITDGGEAEKFLTNLEALTTKRSN